MKSLITLFIISLASLVAAQSFTDVTTSAGLLSVTGGEGIAVGDYNNDGYDDFYVSFPNNKNQLYRNNGDGTFAEVGEVLGVTLGEEVDTRAAVWGDINNDGWLDLYVANRTEADNLFFNNGDGTFKEIGFEAGITLKGYPQAVNMADVNGDGYLDIYVSDFLGDNVLYMNNRNLTFTNYAYVAGVIDNNKSMGAAFFDYDKDGDVDLYLVHDGNEPNILYQNMGNGFFLDVSEASGANTASFGMGVDVGDVNNDGWLDIYITNLFKNILLLNNGDGTFSNISQSADVEDFGMGWGTSFLDFDNDGLIDIYVANDAFFSPVPYPNVLYRNKGDLTFEKVEENLPISGISKSYGAACLDFNLDGHIDVLVANKAENESIQLFQNADRQKHWISLKLIGTTSNRNAIGSKVQITDNLGVLHYKELLAGQSWLSQNSSLLHFGLGNAAEIKELKIIWASGLEEIVTIEELNKIYTITEGGNVEEGIVYSNFSTPNPLDNFDFSIGPNPSSGNFQIGFYAKKDKIHFLEIYNSVGQLLLSQTLNIHDGENVIPIELEVGESQLIMVKIFGEGFSRTKTMMLRK